MPLAQSISCSANISLDKINTLSKNNEIDLDVYDISASDFKQIFYNSYNNEYFNFGFNQNNINHPPDAIVFNKHTYKDIPFNLLNFIINSYVKITNIHINCWDPCSLINIQKHVMSIKSLKDACFNIGYTLSELKSLLTDMDGYLKITVIFKCMLKDNTWEPIIIHFNFRIDDYLTL